MKGAVLCVDDEGHVLEEMKQHLRRRFTVHTALGAARGMEALRRDGPFVAVLSDMRMPGMSGTEFLGKVREHSPDTVRILLTGYSEMSAAVAALNNGLLFRFLTKPCPRERLVSTVEDAQALYALTTGKQERMTRTLRGSVKALVDVLALTSPLAFGRAHRVEGLARSVGQQIGVDPIWQLEVAALLSQLGCVILKDETLERYLNARPLTEVDKQLLQRVPRATDDLLAGIPDLGSVRDIVAVALTMPNAPLVRTPPEEEQEVRRAAHVLGAALAYDRMEGLGMDGADILRRLRTGYSDGIVDGFLPFVGAERSCREASVTELRPGMVLHEDVRTHAGELLVARGVRVTTSLMLRLLGRNSELQEPLYVTAVAEARASA